MKKWTKNKVVVRDFYISFKPMNSDPSQASVDLSGPIISQSRDEPIYVAVIGRPAGFLNFIREFIGLSRRFEFVMSSSQCIQRLGSPSTQILSSSRWQGLNTMTVGLFRPLAQALVVLLLAISLFLAASHTPETASIASPLAGEVLENSSTSQGGIAYPYADQGQSQSEESVAEEATAEMPQYSPNVPGSLSAMKALLLGAAPAWVWFFISGGLGIYSAYLFFIDKRNIIEISESGEVVVGFIVSPSFLETKSTDIPLSDLNKLPMIFRVLKEK